MLAGYVKFVVYLFWPSSFFNYLTKPFQSEEEGIMTSKWIWLECRTRLFFMTYCCCRLKGSMSCVSRLRLKQIYCLSLIYIFLPLNTCSCDMDTMPSLQTSILQKFEYCNNSLTDVWISNLESRNLKPSNFQHLLFWSAYF